MTSSLRFSGARSPVVSRGNGRARSFRPLLVLAITALWFSTCPGLHAQDQNGQPELRTVHGTVIDRNENAVGSGVVYLENMKTQTVKTYITRADGLYRFSGLDPNVDYQLHAEHDGLTSSSHTISSYDSRRDIDLPLKLSHQKNEH
jgi:Carboxypeptidase regulatory-like domain